MVLLSNTTIPTTLDLYPNGVFNTYIPYFSWPSVSTADFYDLFVNDGGLPMILRRIENRYTPEKVNCSLNNDQLCQVTRLVEFARYGGAWFVYTLCLPYNNYTLIVEGAFTIRQ